MRVYHIRSDPQHYQSLSLLDNTIDLMEFYKFTGRSRKEGWKTPEVFSLYPMLDVPDFWGLGATATLTANQEVCEKVSYSFISSGELLPIVFKEKKLALLNITRCVDALDKSKCVFAPGVRRPKKFVFYANRIPSTLFKIPETAVGQVLCAEWDGDPEREFKAAIEHHQLKGLRFKLIWDSESSANSKENQ